MFPSKRLRRIVYRCFFKVMDTKGAGVVTKYGDADVDQFPVAPLVVEATEYDPETDTETVTEVPLRADDNNVVRVLLHAYRPLRYPRAERQLSRPLTPSIGTDARGSWE